MNNRKLGINAILNMTRSIIGMVFPLITFPYVTRILSVNNIGKVSYSSSIVSYFALFAMLGIQVYATREGSKIRDDKIKLQQFVSEVYTLNVISASLSLIILLVLIFNSELFSNYVITMLIFSIQIPLTVIGSDWINSIFEDYTYITIRSILFQIVGLVLIFLLVKDSSHYNRYAFCLVFTSYGSGVLNAIYTKKYCKKRILINRNVLKHLRPILLLFAISVASFIYSNADITMLGLMTTDYCVGIYSTAAKVYNIIKQVVFSIVIVCLPRFSYMVSNETKENYQKTTESLYKLIFMIAVPLSVGLFFLSEPIIQLLAGSDFADSVYPLKFLSVASLFAILAYFIMQLVLLPNKKDSTIFVATLVSGIFNIIANFILIPIFQDVAAAFTTAVSEAIVFAISFYCGKKICPFVLGVKNMITAVWGSALMGSVLYIIVNTEHSTILKLAVGFVSGLVVYMIVLLVTKNEVLYQYLSALKKRIK